MIIFIPTKLYFIFFYLVECFFTPYLCLDKKIIMEKTNIEVDVRDLIKEKLVQIERPLAWLAEKVDVKYSAMYAMFVQRTYEPKQPLIDKINKILETDFVANAA